MSVVKFFIIMTTVLGLFLAVALYIFGSQKIVKAYNHSRPHLISGGGEECLRELTLQNIQFSHLGDMKKGICLVKDAVRIEAFTNTKLSGPIVLNCKAALATHEWLEEIRAKNVVHFGTYNCRTMRGNGVMSEHSFGTAIDIASINGSSVKHHWREKSDRGIYIREAARRACSYFSNSITPDHDARHHDHLHLDMGYGTSCLPPLLQRLEKLMMTLFRNFF